MPIWLRIGGGTGTMFKLCEGTNEFLESKSPRERNAETVSGRDFRLCILHQSPVRYSVQGKQEQHPSRHGAKSHTYIFRL
jgi:hypothetical protein